MTDSQAALRPDQVSQTAACTQSGAPSHGLTKCRVAVNNAQGSRVLTTTMSQKEASGVTNNMNDGSVPCRCPRCGVRILRYPHGMEPSFMSLGSCRVKISAEGRPIGLTYSPALMNTVR